MAIEIRHPRVEIEFCTGCKWYRNKVTWKR